MQKTYDKMGNKALASMNRSAYNQMIEKAEAADAIKKKKYLK